ncbi:hypothetical protein B4U80_07181 [Leptotrombidium deliense]|uniref:Dihydropteridine reductase n=1 Tax=Leptotrombidium deliense TaxID=299467 RepID=A0A443SQI7_9ACAR|nr:hypothetical protein B4U80_07181 [Leptotrombidium deliense]
MSSAKRVLVYGGKGTLANDEANESVIIANLECWTAQETEVVTGVNNILNEEKLDAIICVAGGWAGGNAADKDFIKNSDLVIKQSLWSSAIAAKIAVTYLKEGGLLTLTGAKDALDATPEMIGYGFAKAAVHHLTKSIAAEKSGLPKKSSVLTILPVILDTPLHRKFMPKNDFNDWTPLEFVANLTYKWATKMEERPKSGSLVELVTENGKTNLWVASVDTTASDEANESVIIKNLDCWTTQETEVVGGVNTILNGEKLDAIICVAGGWAGGSAANRDFIKNSDLMVKQSLWSSAIAAKIASEHLKEGGLLTLTGAKAALDATPGMIGYGFAKAAVHHLTKSLAAEKSGLPKDGSVLAILPVTLDTPMNRKFMPKADFNSWTPLEFVANLTYKWATKTEERPKSGSLVQLITDKGETNLLIN